MSRSARERMQAYRRRKQAAGCKSLKLWLNQEGQARLARVRRAGETLDALFLRALEAAEAAAPLQGKIALLQSEYIAPLREEVAALKKRLSAGKSRAAENAPGHLEEAVAQLQARSAKLEQALLRLQREIAELREEQKPVGASRPAGKAPAGRPGKRAKKMPGR